MLFKTLGYTLLALAAVGFAVLLSPMKLRVENPRHAVLCCLFVWGYPAAVMSCGLNFLGVMPMRSFVVTSGLMLTGAAWTWLRYAVFSEP